MPTGDDDTVQVTGLDSSLVDRSGDPMRKHPEQHTVGAPDYMLSEGKAGYQDTMLTGASDEPTAEEIETLRRIPAHIPWKIYTIAFIELVERLSYYGTIAVYSNFIAKPLVTPTGAALDPNSDEAQPGALGKGKQVAFSLTTFNAFWVYCCPLLGAWVADTYLGRYKSIVISVIIAEIGHLILVASSAPSVLAKPETSLGVFILGLIIMGLGTGTFKPNISPLIVEQIPQDNMKIKVLETGERVIVDPAATVTRIYNYFYMFVNLGALGGQLGMVYAERYVGFWLAFAIPTIMFVVCLPVLWICKKFYIMHPPAGNVMGPAFKLLFKALGHGVVANPLQTWRNWKTGDGWDKVTPSYLGDSAPAWYNFDDAWVYEVKRGFGACSVFFWVPIFWLAYRQMDSNLQQMCATMQLNGVPNDLLQNLDPIAIIIIVPIMDLVVYPFLLRKGIRFTPIKKITAGFIVGALAMVWAAVLQHFIYMDADVYNNPREEYKANINVWAVSGVYILIAISEIFASVTTLEYAFTKAPKNMRSLVQAVQLFTSAFSAALAQAFTPLTVDPLIVWNYSAVAIISFVTGVAFAFVYRSMDKAEDQLNMLPTGHLGTAAQAEDVERRLSHAEPRRSTQVVDEKI